MTDGYVIDANVLFSAFISGKNVYRLLFSGTAIYLPDFAFLEIERYKDRILKKTRLSEPEFQAFVLELLQEVTVVPSLVLSPVSVRQAYQGCKDIDAKDTLYVATAIQLNVPLVTQDKALCSALKERAIARVVLLADLVEKYSGPG